jgi:hypothetical protein
MGALVAVAYRVPHGRFKVRPRSFTDVLWKFRWYSVINQALIWLTVALLFGALLERFLGVPPRRGEPDEESAPEPVPAASGQP